MTYNKEEFIMNNTKVLLTLHHEYLNSIKQEILDGDINPETLESFSSKIYRLRHTPSESELMVEGVVWEEL